MKRGFFFALLTASVAAATLAFTGPVETLNVNTQASVINWKGYKVTGQHEGTLAIKSGDLKVENGKLIGGNFVIDMNSITCTDLQGEYGDKLVGHLKSDDFFGVAKHPTAKFVITKVVSRGTPGAYKVTGNLTIKETTKPVTFNTQLTEEAGKTVATADIKLDRSEYDIRFGSGSFFDNLGDKTIYDEFDLNVRLVANK